MEVGFARRRAPTIANGGKRFRSSPSLSFPFSKVTTTKKA
jgi:hypothetical protein